MPPGSLLEKYQHDGAYADCYVTELAGRISHTEYVEAFYTTWLFKIERRLLAWFVSRPSADDQAAQLADGELASFAAWSVEARAINQLLMCDFQGRTRSWLMVEPVVGSTPEVTRLYFGSAVVSIMDANTGKRRMGPVFRVLLGFHKLYSRALLSAARSRLARQRPH
jgi:hypothetical protein